MKSCAAVLCVILSLFSFAVPAIAEEGAQPLTATAPATTPAMPTAADHQLQVLININTELMLIHAAMLELRQQLAEYHAAAGNVPEHH